jgi:hypothetical protein
MRKIVATVVLAACASVFAPSAIPQVAQTAMKFDADTPRKMTSAAMSAGTAVATPVALSSARLLGDASRADAASWMPSLKGPEPAFAWLFALGFLGLVITRRIRSSQQF